jgi:CRISPR-associated endonuclease/helicase Cas3/CRISPR-associated endonuclease Cas3-HD
MYYAHSTDNSDKNDWQALKEHLENVANLASGFAGEFNSGQLGYAGGLLHDIGKYSPEFQKRLEGANIRVDHSTAGAKETEKFYQKFHSRILEYIIAGHHGGLLDYGSPEAGLQERLSRPYPLDYSAYKNEITIPDLNNFNPNLKPINKKMGFTISFYTRMLFSCLVDADFLDTEGFLSPDKSSLRGQYDSFDTLSRNFDNHMNNVLSKVEDNRINRYRREIYDQCREMAELPPQIFSLTVPTGGGKTLSSMAFALDHLKKHNLNRIFYVIPYTSIIEQNAEVFQKIFGNHNVLEHHSNYDPKNEDSENIDLAAEKRKLSSENWDIPIVVTTNVQFFESLFANRVSRCRKLHNLAKSVIILDEAQMLPTVFLKPCLAALSELVVNYGSTVVICTATQPNLNGLLDERVKPVEIMRSPQELYEEFRRVRVTDLGNLDDADLSARLKGHRQVLCIVNTRKHAQKLYEQLSESGNCYHLSARMCPVHRREQLKKIKELLKEGAECRVVSTQLIEAGVDIDFPVVYRAMGGMIFDEWDDPLSLPAVDKYFEKLYSYDGDGLDKEKILPLLEGRLREIAFPFEDVAGRFTLIENNTRDIIIPYDGRAKSTIREMQHSGYPGSYIRKLQGYTVSIYSEEFKELEKSSAISSLEERFFVLNDINGFYSETVGLINRKYNACEHSLFII